MTLPSCHSPSAFSSGGCWSISQYFSASLWMRVHFCPILLTPSPYLSLIPPFLLFLSCSFPLSLTFFLSLWFPFPLSLQSCSLLQSGCCLWPPMRVFLQALRVTEAAAYGCILPMQGSSVRCLHLTTHLLWCKEISWVCLRVGLGDFAEE